MASFAVVEEDQLMLVTNMGQVIRIRVHGGEGDSIRIASRKTLGVRLVDVADDDSEKVVSAGLVRETDSDDEDDHAGDDTSETVAMAPNADGSQATIDTPSDSPSDAADAPNSVDDEDNE